MEMEMYTDDDAVEAVESLPSAQPEPTLEQIEEYCHKRCLSIVDNALLHKYAQPATSCSEIPNTSDFVSRKAVREMVATWAYDLMEQEDLNMALHDVDELPPAQTEVIHCKDCKHRDPEDKKCDSGHAIQWQLPRSDDWFCADAERKQK